MNGTWSKICIENHLIIKGIKSSPILEIKIKLWKVNIRSCGFHLEISQVQTFFQNGHMCRKLIDLNSRAFFKFESV